MHRCARPSTLFSLPRYHPVERVRLTRFLLLRRVGDFDARFCRDSQRSMYNAGVCWLVGRCKSRQNLTSGSGDRAAGNGNEEGTGVAEAALARSHGCNEEMRYPDGHGRMQGVLPRNSGSIFPVILRLFGVRFCRDLQQITINGHVLYIKR